MNNNTLLNPAVAALSTEAGFRDHSDSGRVGLFDDHSYNFVLSCKLGKVLQSLMLEVFYSGMKLYIITLERSMKTATCFPDLGFSIIWSLQRELAYQANVESFICCTGSNMSLN